MELALLIFRGSLDFNVEMNRLRTTVKKMQHDSNLQCNHEVSNMICYTPDDIHLFISTVSLMASTDTFCPFDSRKGNKAYDLKRAVNSP
jgi:hypothetical protein